MRQVKRGLPEASILGHVHQQKKRQNEQQGVLNPGFRPRQISLSLPEIHSKYMQNIVKNLFKIS
jgi:hypothetical protein